MQDAEGRNRRNPGRACDRELFCLQVIPPAHWAHCVDVSSVDTPAGFVGTFVGQDPPSTLDPVAVGWSLGISCSYLSAEDCWKWVSVESPT